MFKFIRYYPFYKGRGWFIFLNIVQKYLKSLPLRLRASLYDGQIIFINPREYIGAMVYLFGDLDPKISWCIKKLLKKGDLFIDIGANCGTETIPASKIVEKDGAVHAFEPNLRFGIFPRFKKVINHNISQSSFDYCFMLNK